MKTKIIATLMLCTLSLTAAAQETYDLTIDKPERYGLVPKNSFTATWHLWVPEGEQPKQVLFIIPAAGGQDTTANFKQREVSQFAAKHHLAVLTVGFDYKAEVPRHNKVELWSGRMTLDALKKLAAEAGQPGLAELPLLLWGRHDVGGAMAGNFAAWKPSRVTALAAHGLGFDKPQEVEKVPALLADAGDVANLQKNARALELLAKGRRHNAPWVFAPINEEQPYVLLSLAFFEAVLADKKIPWLGNLKDKTIAPADGENPASTKDTVWLPDEDFAHTWQLFVGGKE